MLLKKKLKETKLRGKKSGLKKKVEFHASTRHCKEEESKKKEG